MNKPLVVNIVGLAFTAVLVSCAACPAADMPSTKPTKNAYLRIADEVDANLQKEILEKFFPATVNEQGGGFCENYSRDWTPTGGKNKSIVYQGRLTWTSAEAARRFPAKADLYLAMTRRGAACLADKLWDKTGGGFFWHVDAKGRPTSDTKQMYGHAFGIYALAANYQATKDRAALDLAKKAFQWLEQHAHDNVNKGYAEAIGPGGKPVTRGGPNAVGAGAGQKSMNTSIHVLEALTGLYQVWPDPLLGTRVQEMLEVCRDKVYCQPGYLTQFFSADWKRTSSPDSFGHDVEAGFLMVEAAEALNRDDPRAWRAARQLVDHAMRYGWDERRGGLYDSGTMDAEGAVTGDLRTEKIWWVEAEHLNALLLLHERLGKETNQYWDAFVKQWDWITRYQVDHTYGGWYATVRADGAPASSAKADMWTECYHQGRAMLTVSARLRKLAAEK
ncbi:MAG: AGE family epimerase/isomerase [Thermoguttaceae bacterium]|jgi:mannobiose 2-epimerase